MVCVALMALLLTGCTLWQHWQGVLAPSDEAPATAAALTAVPTIPARPSPTASVMPPPTMVRPTAPMTLPPPSPTVTDPPPSATPRVMPTPIILPAWTATPAGPPAIILFEAAAAEVDAAALRQRQATIDVRWAVVNRPAGSNLVFEQVMATGDVRSVELPRPFVEIASEGLGQVVPYPPSGDQSPVLLQLRLVDVASGATLARATISLPVVSRPAGGQMPDGVVVVSFSAEPSTVAAGAPVTLSWQVQGVDGVNLYLYYDGLEDLNVLLNPGGRPLPAAGTLTVSAPTAVTSAVYKLFDVSSDHRRTVQVICAYAWFAAAGPADFCPTGPPRTVQATFQSFERGWMIWHEGEIWVTMPDYANSLFPDTWDGGPVTYPEAPPAGLLQPDLGFGTLWVNNPEVREALGWATAPEQSYPMQLQQTAVLHRYPGPRHHWVSSILLVGLPDGSVRRAEMDENGDWLRWLD